MKAGLIGLIGSAAIWGASMMPAGTAHAEDFQILTFDAPGADTTPNDFNGTFPVGINNWGIIAGYYYDSSNTAHGFLRGADGKIKKFDAPDSYGTYINNINDLGAVTGNFVDASGNVHGFLRSAEGAFTVIDAPGASGYTNPIALNLEGAIVGYYLDANSQFHAFQRKPDGKMTAFDGPDACETGTAAGCYGTAAFNINIFGLVAAAYGDNSGNFVNHVFLRNRSGKDTVLDAPGAGSGLYQGTGCSGCALGLNASGEIAGTYTDAQGVFHGFLRTPNGVITTFDAPGAGTAGNQGTGCFSDCSTGLNDVGELTGNYIDSNGAYHGFVRRPDGKIKSVDPQASIATFPTNINDFGTIAGSYLDANNVWHGFLTIPSRH